MNILTLLRTQLDTLLEQRATAVAEAEAIAALAEAEQRSALTAEEDAILTTHLDAIRSVDEQITAKQARITELEEIEKRTMQTRSRDRVPGMTQVGSIDPTSRNVPSAELRSHARGMVEQSRIYARADHQEAVTKILERMDDDGVADYAARLVIATSTPEYIRAWSKTLTGRTLTAEDATLLGRADEIRTTMTSGGTSAGGYAVPVPIDSTFILTGAGSSNPFRRISRQTFLAEGNTWKGVSAAQVTASFDSENAEVSDDSPTLTQPSIATAMGRAFAQFSIEGSADIPDLVNQLSVIFMDAKDNLEASNFATSSTAPKGIMSVVAAVTASRVSSTTGGAYAVADVYKLQQNLPARHRLNGTSRAFVMNNITINTTRQFATANNYHFYLVDGTAGAPSTLLGDTLVEASSITSTVTTGNDLIVYGDFAKYLIVDKLGMTTEYIPHLFATANNLPSGTRGVFCYWRVGSDVLDADAFRVLRL